MYSSRKTNGSWCYHISDKITNRIICLVFKLSSGYFVYGNDLVSCCPNSRSMYISATNGRFWSHCGHNIYMSCADYNIYTYKHTHNYIHVCISTPNVHVPALPTHRHCRRPGQTVVSSLVACQVYRHHAKSTGLVPSPLALPSVHTHTMPATGIQPS